MYRYEYVTNRASKMVTTTHLEPVAKRFLLLTNILSTVKIDKLVVPEVVGNDCVDAVLDCVYSGVGDDVTVVWLHNGSQVYEWRRGAESEVQGVLEGRLDLTYRLTTGRNGMTERRALRIVELALELSGEYTCVVRSRGQEARATSTMTVFSPEREFELTYYYNTSNGTTQKKRSNLESDVGVIEIKCAAKRLHPQPDLMIEYNKVPISQQQIRIWREGAFFEAECLATLDHASLDLSDRAELACRLHLPQVDYTAITKKYLHFGNRFSNANLTTATTYITLLGILFSNVFRI